MRNSLLIILVLASLSAAEKPDPRHGASYEMTIDQLSLTVRYPTFNDPGKPIVVSVVFENNSDQGVQYIGYPGAPFFITVVDGQGKKLFDQDTGPQDLSGSLLEPHSSLEHNYELSGILRDAGTYFISVSRPINERDNEQWRDMRLEHLRLYIGKPLNPFPSL